MWFTMIPYDPNAAEGLAGMKRTIELNRAAFPDMQLVVDDQIAAGDNVATRWHAEMTHLGTLGSVPATGRRVTMTGMNIDRFAGGKIVEGWRSMDVLGFRLSIGAPTGT